MFVIWIFIWDLYAFISTIGKSNEVIEVWNAYEIWMFLFLYFTSRICMDYVRIMNLYGLGMIYDI
jgi:hypothetical protein